MEVGDVSLDKVMNMSADGVVEYSDEERGRMESPAARAEAEQMQDLFNAAARKGHATLEQIGRARMKAEEGIETLDEIFSFLEAHGIAVYEDKEELQGAPSQDGSTPVDGRSDGNGLLSDIPVHDTIGLYLREMSQEPLLSREEEIELAQQMDRGKAAMHRLRTEELDARERRELKQQIQAAEEARARFIRANIRLVVSIAKRYRGHGVPFLDLMQEGNLGLMKAEDLLLKARICMEAGATGLIFGRNMWQRPFVEGLAITQNGEADPSQVNGYVNSGCMSAGAEGCAGLSMKTGVAMVMAAIGLLTLMCCRRTSIAPAEDYDGTQRLVNSAIADLAGQLDVARTGIAVQSVEATEFPDASLGVPEPGKMYAQVITPGYIIRLAVDGEVYQYHGSGDQVVSVPRNEGSNPTGDRITIDHVQIKVGGQISFSGRTTLPEGTCLQAQLFAEDDPVNWWPRDTCVEVQQGDWEVSVPLPEDDGTEALGTSTQYRLRMWQRAQPSVKSWFHFDLAGPPMPEE